ncbi:unnamed protein product [Pleuronectes platessa]|uniref:Uncharacterized protein n=1 Tax=Pleuronectes platessa TaxID=8262 RepID=A0A9N7UQ70_PLEPL|nr:unnamed protein product [Pleuronectes platessa]
MTKAKNPTLSVGVTTSSLVVKSQTPPQFVSGPRTNTWGSWGRRSGGSAVVDAAHWREEEGGGGGGAALLQMRRRKRSAVVPWSDLISVCLSPVTELLLLLLLEETGAAIRTSCLHSETLFKLLILFWRGRLFGGFYARRRARDWNVKTVTVPRCERMEKHKVLDQLLMELHRFLLILDKETLSGNATVQKGLLADILHSYRASNGKEGELRIIDC